MGTTKLSRIWWASPCAAGDFYDDWSEAEILGPCWFCAECGGYHVQDSSDASDARTAVLAANHAEGPRRRDHRDTEGDPDRAARF